MNVGRATPPVAGLQATQLHFCYGDVGVLEGADLRVRPGRRLAVLGANGSGKTTMLCCLSGALEPSSGRVRLDGQVVRFDRRGLARHREVVQLVLQDPDDQLFSADVSRDVSFGPLNLGLPEHEVRSRVAEALHLLDIADLADRPTHQLSFGQRKRVAIAGAVAMAPRYLLLDEPTAGLDPEGVRELVGALGRLESGGTTVVLATHDVDFALAWADDAAIVADGRVESGPAAQVLGQLPDGSRLHMPWVLELLRRLGFTERAVSEHPDQVPRTLDEVVELLGQALAQAPAASKSDSPR